MQADKVIFVSEYTQKIIHYILDLKEINIKKCHVINPLPSITNSLLHKEMSIYQNFNSKNKFILFNY